MIDQTSGTEWFEEAVLNMEPNEIYKLYAENGNAVFMGRALGLACRFRGFETVKTLFECGAEFEVPTVKKVKEGSSSEYLKRDCNYSNYSLYLLNIEKQIKGAACCSGIKFPKKVKLENGKTLTQIPDSERVKVLDFLCEHSEKLCFDPAELLYYSIFVRDDVITGELKKLGVGLSPDRVKALTSVRDKDIRYWIEFGSMMNKLSDEDFIPVISKLYSELGKKLRVSKKTFDSMRSRVSNDAIIECFKEKFEMKGVPKSFILRKVLKQNDTMPLVLAEKIGWLAEARRRDLLIDYSIKDNAAECTAWLLDFKNRTADLAAERRKAERKLERELNAAPDSVTVLKALWSYRKLEDGTLMIKRYKGNQTEITVPRKIGKNIVTAIGDYAFSLRKNAYAPEWAEFLRTIKKITLPDTLTRIGSCAFKGCRGLSAIDIPDSVREIGSYAFYGCSGLSALVIPDGVIAINKEAFANCKNLKTVVLPVSLTEITGGYYYKGKVKFTIFYNSENVTAVIEKGSCAENYCKQNDIPYTYKEETKNE